jgi:hypothetical protein
MWLSTKTKCSYPGRRIWFATVYRVSLYNALLREYFNLIFVPELGLKDTTNTASPPSYLELHPVKLTVRVV